MKRFKKFLGLILFSIVLFGTCTFSYADNDKLIKFKIGVKPNQKKVEARIDGDEHKRIQIKGAFLKLNPITNNYHIEITFINNSGQVLPHQLAVIEKVEHAEIKFPDGTTNFNNLDDDKQEMVTGPYYNYGNIKQGQATPRVWYLASVGKEEIEIKGYLIEKEIPIILDPKIVQTDPKIAATLTTYLTALRDNDLEGVIATLAKPNKYFAKDLPKQYTDDYTNYPGSFLNAIEISHTPDRIGGIPGTIFVLEYDWIDPDDGSKNLWILELQYDGTKWWITR